MTIHSHLSMQESLHSLRFTYTNTPATSYPHAQNSHFEICSSDHNLNL